MKRALIYVHGGFADWEASFILPELRDAHYEVQSIAESQEPVTSMGGLRIIPDLVLAESGLDLDGVEILIIPGGQSWKIPTQHRAILQLLPTLRSRDVTIAAICDATLGLARAGLLNTIHHTSNHLPALKAAVPEYQGERLFVSDRLAVTDECIITASGIGALEFAREIINDLVLMTEPESEEWYQFFKVGKLPKSYADRGHGHRNGTPPSPEIFGGP